MEGDGWTPALSPWGQTSDRRRGPALALLLNGERSSVSIPRMLNQIGVLSMKRHFLGPCVGRYGYIAEVDLHPWGTAVDRSTPRA